MESTEFQIRTIDELQEVAQFICRIQSYSIIVFIGNLGAGKTTLIKEICRALDVTDEVSSPTFSLINHYKKRDDQDVFHFDFYRIETTEEAVNIGFEEYLDSGSLCLIEWPEKIMQLIIGPYVQVEIEVEDLARKIKVTTHP